MNLSMSKRVTDIADEITNSEVPYDNVSIDPVDVSIAVAKYGKDKVTEALWFIRDEQDDQELRDHMSEFGCSQPP